MGIKKIIQEKDEVEGLVAQGDLWAAMYMANNVFVHSQDAFIELDEVSRDSLGYELKLANGESVYDSLRRCYFSNLAIYFPVKD